HAAAPPAPAHQAPQQTPPAAAAHPSQISSSKERLSHRTKCLTRRTRCLTRQTKCVARETDHHAAAGGAGGRRGLSPGPCLLRTVEATNQTLVARPRVPSAAASQRVPARAPAPLRPRPPPLPRHQATRGRAHYRRSPTRCTLRRLVVPA